MRVQKSLKVIANIIANHKSAWVGGAEPADDAGFIAARGDVRADDYEKPVRFRVAGLLGKLWLGRDVAVRELSLSGFIEVRASDRHVNGRSRFASGRKDGR